MTESAIRNATLSSSFMTISIAKLLQRKGVICNKMTECATWNVTKKNMSETGMTVLVRSVLYTN